MPVYAPSCKRNDHIVSTKFRTTICRRRTRGLSSGLRAATKFLLLPCLSSRRMFRNLREGTRFAGAYGISEREKRKLGRDSERHYRVGEGIIETKFGSFEGSQAVPASPSGRGEACIRDLFNFLFKRCLSGCCCLPWQPYWTHRYNPYLTGNILRLRYRTQPVNADCGNSRCLLRRERESWGEG
jgi:hypothetical protein